MTLIGIDGCRVGWTIATSAGSLSDLTFSVALDVRDAIEQTRQGAAIAAIDIPIGLPSKGSRASDIEARRVLGPGQGSRVFPAPSRAALDGATYEECCALNRAASGVSLSRQGHAILAKIREVDLLMRPELQTAFREVHPEVAFCVLRGRPLVHRKKTAEGQQERLGILHQHGIDFDPVHQRRRLGASRVEIDDLIDAAVSLITASRIRDGCMRVLGDRALDARGLRMEIVA